MKPKTLYLIMRFRDKEWKEIGRFLEEQEARETLAHLRLMNPAHKNLKLFRQTTTTEPL